MKTIYTCICGKQHKAENKECQDIVKSFCSDNLLVLALCDGAGSKKYSTKAAQTIAETTLDLIKEDFNLKPSKFIETLNDRLFNQDLNEKNAGTTLMFVAVKKNKYILGHVGDGVILKGNQDGFKAISLPENGHLVNITYFLPSENPGEHFRFQTGNINGKTAFILASDGVSDFLYDSKTQTGYNACNLFYEWANTLKKDDCENNIKVCLESELQKYSSDDMSVAIAVIE